jgi:nickel/cobalt transporter (NicO) family protein
MSLNIADFAATRRQAGLPLERLLYAILATAIVAIGLGVLSWLLLASGALPAAPRNPFGMTLREVAPSPTGIGGFILAAQAQFYGALTMAVKALKTGDAGVTSLATIGFLYGIFHAAGPGHGKGVISAYIVANKRSLRRGLGLSLAAALLQATVAVLLVGVLALILDASAASINAAARTIELASFAAIAALGVVLVWWKAGQFVNFAAHARGDRAELEEENDHLPVPAVVDNIKDWQGMAAVVLAAGIRPCSGAILLLVFALSQGLFAAGVVGAFAMACGTAITTGTLASLAVFAKATLLRLTAGRGAGHLIVGAFELLAAAFVLILGFILLTGLWTGGLPSALD